VLRGALVAGRSEAGSAELSQVDLEGAVQGLAAAGLDILDVRSLDVEGDVVVAVTEGGQAFVSHDAGSNFVLLGGQTSAHGGGAVLPEPTRDSHVVQAAIAGGRVWMRTRRGDLLAVAWSEADKERSRVEHCDAGGRVAAIARDSVFRVAALAIDDDGRPVAIVRGLPDGSLVRERADGPESKAPALLAIRARNVAYAGQQGGVVRSIGGGDLAGFVWEGRVTALSFVDDGGTIVVATYSEVDDTTALVKLDTDGRASVVARIGPSHPDADADGRVLAMAHDEARGVVWVAGGFGVAAYAMQ
jgi:translation initiation factor IF-1